MRAFLSALPKAALQTEQEQLAVVISERVQKGVHGVVLF